MINFALVNVFLPSMHGTKLRLMRDILSETKLFLRQNDLNTWKYHATKRFP